MQDDANVEHIKISSRFFMQNDANVEHIEISYFPVSLCKMTLMLSIWKSLLLYAK